MHGIVLKSLGHHVHVLEAREPEEMEAETAGLSLAAEAQELMKTYVEGAEDYAMSPSSSIQVVGLKGEVLIELPIEFSSITSTWGTVFQRLHHAFLARGTAGGPTKFEFRQRVLDVNEEYDAILVTYHDTTSGTVSTVRAHLVVAADGSNSIVRAQVLPQVEPTFAGYVAWRGYISESAVPEAMRGVFENKIIMTQVKDGYLLAYVFATMVYTLTEFDPTADISHQLSVAA
jgi:2-polyprenyl-6-methoxyphenol hydroxylase-like FAD-dependent oxidoreductase